MIIFLLMQTLVTQQTIDSLATIHNENPRFQTAMMLHKYYLQQVNYEDGITLLQAYELVAPWEEKADVLFILGETYFYKGELLRARAEYLNLTTRFPRDDIANDALERLYLLENLRSDTTLVKRLSHALFLHFIEQTPDAIDSLRSLLSTSIGAYSYYHLALIYKSMDEWSLALGALEELEEKNPHHDISGALLLLAEVYLVVGNTEKAYMILEDVILRNPHSIQAARAQKILNKK